MSENTPTPTPLMSRSIFTPWDVLWLLSIPTLHWAPYPELRGAAILVMLIGATLAVARTMWELLSGWCVPAGTVADCWPEPYWVLWPDEETQ